MVKVTLRKSEERGYSDLGWLQANFTFSFSHYYDPKHMEFGSLRVLNEDIVHPRNGFGTHRHQEFEIFTYMISGEIEHIDSMGNKETVKRGQVQFTTAGSGIAHSEKNMHKQKKAHLLQIWVKPNQSLLTPSYETLDYKEEDRKNQFLCLISPGDRETAEIKNTIGIHNEFYMSTIVLDPNTEVSYSRLGKWNKDFKLYIHVVQKGDEKDILLMNKEFELSPGDGAYMTNFSQSENKVYFNNLGSNKLEFVVLEMSK